MQAEAPTRENRGRKTVLVWAPQPGPQKALIDCPFAEIFFGGTRGGGKTDGVIGKWAIKERRHGKHFYGVMFRRSTVSAEDAIERSKQIYTPLGGKFNEQRLQWRMPNGGRVAFRYLESVSDADEWQGQNLSDAWIEEVGQYPSSAPIFRLFGLLRSAHGVPTQLILTGNPGGAGQHWLRARYQLHPFPERPRVIELKLDNGEIHRIAVIPSRITDNRIMLDADPTYINRLHMVGSPQLVRAWLKGDWSAVEGAFFDCWDESRHVVRPFAIPDHWLRFMSGDWGSAVPFSFGWWAVVSDPHELQDGRVLPRGALVRYREWYGKGDKLTAEQVAIGILEREPGEKITYRKLDPSAFKQDGGPSIPERMYEATNGVVCFERADNTRISQRGAMGGWDQMRSRLVGVDGVPMIYCFSTCTDSIRTIPVLQHDQDKAEDLDTNSEDHAADDWRYGCMSRPWIRPPPPVPQKPRTMTWNEFIESHEQLRSDRI